jgi:hypothetical protein
LAKDEAMTEARILELFAYKSEKLHGVAFDRYRELVMKVEEIRDLRHSINDCVNILLDVPARYTKE